MLLASGPVACVAEDVLAKRTNCLIMQRRKGGCACAQEIEEVHSVSASDYNGRPGRGRSRPNREVTSQHCHCRCIRGPRHPKDYIQSGYLAQVMSETGHGRLTQTCQMVKRLTCVLKRIVMHSLRYTNNEVLAGPSLALPLREHSHMTSSMRKRGLAQKQIRVLVGCVSVTVTRNRGEG